MAAERQSRKFILKHIIAQALTLSPLVAFTPSAFASPQTCAEAFLGAPVLAQAASHQPIGAQPATPEIKIDPLAIAERYNNFIEAFEKKLADFESTRPPIDYKSPDYRLKEKTYSDLYLRILREKFRFVYKLLQEVFYPIVDRITDRLNSKSKSDLHSSLLRMDNQFPVIHERFKLYRYAAEIVFDRKRNGQRRDGYWGRPVIDIPQDRDTTVALDKMITGNLTRAVNHYWKILFTPLFSVSESYLRVDPDRSFVEPYGRTTMQFSTYITPVGEYGESFSRAILRTTQIVTKMMADDPELRDLSESSYREASKFLDQNTARAGEAENEKFSPQLAPVSSAMEGVLSLHQLIGVMLSKKIPGIESGPEALRTLVLESGDTKLGLLSEVTTMLPMGYIGPLGLSGLHFSHPLIRNKDGRLTLDKETRDKLVEASQDEMKKKSRCPMAGLMNRSQSKTGIQKVAEAYLRVFEIVSAGSGGHPQQSSPAAARR